MNTATLPGLRTLQPSREGLVYHEIVADGFIHAAVVAGFPADEHFLSRVATLAWCNGVLLMAKDILSAADTAARLRESLEASDETITALCRTADMMVSTEEGNWIQGLRAYHLSRPTVAGLVPTDPEDATAIRHVIGEAALAGLRCRARTAWLHAALLAEIEATRGTERYLSTRLWIWAYHDGLPTGHPFLELVEMYYPRTPRERALILDGVARVLGPALDAPDPWAPDYWLEAGWRHGGKVAGFAPDAARGAVAEFSSAVRTNNRDIFALVRPHRGAGPTPDLAGGWEAFCEKWDPEGLGPAKVRLAHPLITAARAYDFAFWWGMEQAIPKLFSSENAPPA